MRSVAIIPLALIMLNAVALASGPPCWDDNPPTNKYSQRHVVSGNDNRLSADGLTVSTQKSETDKAIIVQVTVTNCSAGTVEVVPAAYDLIAVGPGGPENDKRLVHLDPTQFPLPNNPRRAAPALRPDKLEYGRIGLYMLVFAPDTYYPARDHSERLPVVIGKWQFDFYFQKKGTH
jgi:hypothetical protein